MTKRASSTASTTGRSFSVRQGTASSEDQFFIDDNGEPILEDNGLIEIYGAL